MHKGFIYLLYLDKFFKVKIDLWYIYCKILK